MTLSTGTLHRKPLSRTPTGTPRYGCSCLCISTCFRTTVSSSPPLPASPSFPLSVPHLPSLTPLCDHPSLLLPSVSPGPGSWSPGSGPPSRPPAHHHPHPPSSISAASGLSSVGHAAPTSASAQEVSATSLNADSFQVGSWNPAHRYVRLTLLC